MRRISRSRQGGDNLDNNWIVDNLQNALTIWNDKLAEMWTLLTE